MQSTTPSAGDPIEARCTKCRKNTNHTIVAMVEATPAKVKCNTCEGEHKFRPPTAPRKTAVRRTVDPKIAQQKEFESLRPTINSKQAATYAMTSAFKVGSQLSHPTFGHGFVQRVVGPQKIEVLFEDGKKTMRCK